MNREQQIISITRRKVAQGFSADEQYAALNAAREKRKKKRERNLQQMLSGGVKQVPVIGSSAAVEERSKKEFVVEEILSESAPTTVEDQAFILRRIKKLAPKIRSNSQLRIILRQIAPVERKAFFKLLQPHLEFIVSTDIDSLFPGALTSN